MTVEICQECIENEKIIEVLEEQLKRREQQLKEANEKIERMKCHTNCNVLISESTQCMDNYFGLKCPCENWQLREK